MQAASYNQANARRIEASQLSNRANGQTLVDVVMFTNWIAAYNAGDVRLTAFYERRFRDEFASAFGAWVASEPQKNPQAASTPFALPGYRPALQERALQLEAEAAQLFKQGQAANQHGDNYVRDSVLLSGVMFFAGISQQIVRAPSRIAMVAVAFLLCLAGLGPLLMLPIA